MGSFEEDVMSYRVILKEQFLLLFLIWMNRNCYISLVRIYTLPGQSSSQEVYQAALPNSSMWLVNLLSTILMLSLFQIPRFQILPVVGIPGIRLVNIQLGTLCC